MPNSIAAKSTKAVSFRTFSMRSLLLTVGTLAVLLAGKSNEVSNRRAIVARIQERGGRVTYQHQYPDGFLFSSDILPETASTTARPPGGAFLASILGDDFFARPIAVYLGKQTTDADVLAVSRLPGITALVCMSNQLTDAGLHHIQQMKSLEHVCVQGDGISIEGATRFGDAMANCDAMILPIRSDDVDW